jgi:hypothetical protein
MIRYSDNPEINRAVTALIAETERNPYARGSLEEKTIGFILEIVRARFGDYARSAKITVH